LSLPHEYFGLSHEYFGLSHEYFGLSHEYFGLSHEYFGLSNWARPVPRPWTNNKSTMAECNNVVIDLISITTDDDDSSSSSIDTYYDSFDLGIDHHGEVFVKDKVIIIDMDDETTRSTTTTATTFDGIFETDSSCCSSRSLSEDSWYRKRAIRPSKMRHDLSAMYVSSIRVFLAAAIVVPGDGNRGHQSCRQHPGS
jgi:hypothetical protein